MPADSDRDLVHLERAVELASRGVGRVNPNPLVGAVVVRDGEVLGEGWHREYGQAHAEVDAINAAGGPESVRGATMYVSLEPCCHQGRTPPCTDALIEAGIARVVMASDDPSSKASGRGLGILRDEGIEVVQIEGELRDRAVAINQPFRKHAKTGRPWVLAKFAQSLDGKVAAQGGDSKWISGEESRNLVHVWRSGIDAIAVGIGTALADDPQLTARDVGAFRQPRRVVFDSGARLPLDSRLVADSSDVALTVVVGRAAPRSAVDAFEASGVEVIVATGENEAARVTSALDSLGEQGVTSLMLEGGPRLSGAFLDADEIDELRVFIAPVLFGAHAARDPFEGSGSETVAASMRIPTPTVERIGDDLFLKSTLKEW
jgi:diaminohydroxyphosphoribosylaminopyrimidine deaminase/5-amino-6-(5-phosphoribosylamino)uracil reductase